MTVRGADDRELLEHVRSRARTYFADLPGGEVRVGVASDRTSNRARIVRLRISAGPVVRHAVAKVPLATASRSDLTTDRPRLGGTPDPEVDRFQFACMRAVHEHIGGKGDPRFGTVRPLDHLPERGTIVMEAIDEPTLRDLALRSVLLSGRRSGLARAFANVGAWLRAFHELPASPGTPHVRATVAGVDEYLSSQLDFLEARLGGGARVARLRRELLARAGDVLPQSLPLALSHGDLAPRNVFVSQQQAVAVFDMVGKLLAPVYEDLAYFRVALRASTVRLASQGRLLPPALLRRYEQETLDGYFGAERGQAAGVRFYETLVLLDRWASYVAREEQPGRRLPSRLLSRLVYRQLDRELKVVSKLA